MNGQVKLRLGGVEHVLRVPLDVAPAIEVRAGRGLLVVAKDVMDRTATTALCVDIICEALATNDKPAERAEVYTMLGTEGLVHAYICASLIIAELLYVPTEARKGKAGALGKGAN